MTNKRRLISIQTEGIDRFRKSHKDELVSFGQSTDSVAVVQIFDDMELGNPKSSNIIPGTIHCACTSSKGDIVALMVDAKFGVAKSTSMEFEYFNISHSTELFKLGIQMQFSPFDSNEVAVLLDRGIRIYDITRSFSASSDVIPKPSSVISGASAQASPMSFAYSPHSPDVIVSGWDIPNNQYLRIVDLREGTQKSVRILKTASIHGLSFSPVDDRYLAASSDTSISIFDMRKLSQPKSSSRIEPLYSRPTQSRAQDLLWSPNKKATIAAIFQDSSGPKINVWYPEINRLLPISDPAPFVWSKFDSSSIITLDESSGKVSQKFIPEFPIPLVSPRTGTIQSFSSTTGFHRNLSYSELHQSVQAIAKQLGESTDNSLIDAIEKSHVETGLCDHLDWAFPNSVTCSSIKAPLIDRMSPDPLISAKNRFGLIPLHSDPSRLAIVESLLPKNFHPILIGLMDGQFDFVLKHLITDKFPDHVFIQSITMHVVGTEGHSPLVSSAPLPGYMQHTVSTVNEVISTPSDQEVFNVLVKAVSSPPESDSHFFVQAAFAVMYFNREKLADYLTSISHRPRSVRGIVVTGLDKANLSLCDPLHVALLGLLLIDHDEKFSKYFDFLRNLCNQLGGDLWSLRAIVDAVILPESVSFGSTSVVCYYCNKPFVGDEMSWNSGITGLICRCPNRGCHKPLPACCVCLEPINVAPTATVFCTTCRHGGHKDHLVDWFRTSDECPIAGCNCQCANVDGC